MSDVSALAGLETEALRAGVGLPKLLGMARKLLAFLQSLGLTTDELKSIAQQVMAAIQSGEITDWLGVIEAITAAIGSDAEVTAMGDVEAEAIDPATIALIAQLVLEALKLLKKIRDQRHPPTEPAA